MEATTERQRLLEAAGAANETQPLDERVGDAPPGDGHRVGQEIVRQIGGDATRSAHVRTVPAVHTGVNTYVNTVDAGVARC